MSAVEFNESFKALVRESFPDKSEKVLSVFGELVSNKATNDRLSVQELKTRAVSEIKGEIATKDFIRAEIAEVRAEFADVRESLRGELADVRAEFADVRESLRGEIASAKVDILKWVFGLQAGTIVIILGALKLMLN